jgi:hypothetical protein
VSLSHFCVSKSHCVWKLHSACRNHILRVAIKLCVCKSHFAFRNYSRACVYHMFITYLLVNITHKSDFYTQSVVFTRMNVIIIFVSVIITLIRVNIALWVYKSLLWVIPSQLDKKKGKRHPWSRICLIIFYSKLQSITRKCFIPC